MVAKKYIDSVRAHCPQVKLLYMAHDLHFLREMRRAEIEGNQKLKYFAKKLKQLELDLWREVILRLCSVMPKNRSWMQSTVK